MPALISVSNPDGCVSRCDSRCYDAQKTDCDCICGGKNHGAGLDQARENIRELLPADFVEAYALAHGLDPAALQVDAQRDLFPYGNAHTSTRELRREQRRATKAPRAGSNIGSIGKCG